MKEFRVTKYNPAKRNNQDHYLDREEWTEFGDVGDLVSIEDYEAVESKYVDAAYTLLSLANIGTLKIKALENYQNKCPFKEGGLVSINDLRSIIKSILRNDYWCLLESDNAFVHLGYDFYMYIGISIVQSEVIEQIQSKGLFVEEFVSPFHPEDC